MSERKLLLFMSKNCIICHKEVRFIRKIKAVREQNRYFADNNRSEISAGWHLVSEHMADIDKTLKYYNENAQSFCFWDCFRKVYRNAGQISGESLIRDAYILDFGCGAGRDTKVLFRASGYLVDAIDGSEQLCQIASEHTGIKVRQMLFQELEVNEKYDGIWACASILHLPKKELKEVLKKYASQR